MSNVTNKMLRSCLILRTRLLWAWRLGTLGSRSVLGLHGLVNNPRVVSIGDRVTLCDYFILADLNPAHARHPKIEIGDGSTILYRFQCNAAESVRIGENVLIASNVLITDSDHVVEPDGLPVTRNPQLITRPVEIGHGCWIAQNVVIVKGVRIGECSIIGANSVVTRDVPARSVVAGNPARILRSL